MRRGNIIVGGNIGSGSCLEMISGSVIVLGKIGNTTPDTGDFTTITSSGTTTATGGFIGNLTGAATQITLDAASAGNPHFITLVDTISGNRAPRTTSGLTFNPSTNALLKLAIIPLFFESFSLALFRL